MNAALSANSRWGSWRDERQSALATGQYRPVVAQSITRHNKPTETDAERQARHAEATGTHRGMWK